MDFLASMVRFFAINLVKGSTYAFLKSGVIVTTALFSYKYTKIPLKKHQKSGCLIVFIGLLIVAASNLIG
jgi:drug/metabolite transporter (DMT)-like permease